MLSIRETEVDGGRRKNDVLLRPFVWSSFLLSGSSISHFQSKRILVI